MIVISALKPLLVVVTRVPYVTYQKSEIKSWKSRVAVFWEVLKVQLQSKKAKSYIVEEGVRDQKVRNHEDMSEVRSKYQVLDLRLGTKVKKQAMDK